MALQRELGVPLIVGVAVAGAGLVVIPPVAPQVSSTQHRTIRLVNGTADLAGSDAPLGHGPAFVIGGSTISVPPPGYVAAVDKLYLQPLGYTGTPQGLFTPEGLYPVTGVKSLPFDQSAQQGTQILDETILQDYHHGELSAADPAVVFGWSQGAAISTMVMPELAQQGVPSDDVRFVLVGDTNAPAGGMLERFDVPISGQSPQAPALGITFNGPTPSDLYPTDIYTTEYDVFADFPRYPINFLADLNAYLGITEHASYPVLTADQVSSALALPTSTADTLTNYHLIPSETLPLLVPLQFLPFVGQPLYGLLEPDLRILVNLGYGSIDQGWDPGPADAPTTFGLFPSGLNWGDVAAALGSGLQNGVTDAVQQLLSPANYDLSTILQNPVLTELIGLVHVLGFTDATSITQLDLPSLLEIARNALRDLVNFPTSDASLVSSSPTEIINSITGTISGDYATLLPIADTINTALTTVPSLLAGFASEQLADGNPLAAIGDPIAAMVGLVPFAFIFGAGVPIFEALGGTLVNLADLIGLGGDLTP